MKNYLIIFFLFFIVSKVQSIESKIIHKIENEIITNIDIKNQFKYLVALNNNLKNLGNEQIFNISNESAIREKIKIIELKKNFKKIRINEEYLNLILKNTYSRLNLKSQNEFRLYLSDYSLTLEDIKKKLTIEALWNELIIQKFSKNIKINENKVRDEITKKINIQLKEYKLSEIIFEVKNKDEVTSKYNEIVKNITKIGFGNTAAIYSISETSKTEGNIGWINENSLNNTINKSISNLKIGDISKPIILSSGILILKITNLKNTKINIDEEDEIKKAIKYEQNRQLKQYSKIYYNKVKKNIELNE
ncbi:peptidylprolyl isomerase [Candidatus Pelagibacter sp.]|nr:peptidylprolyl isomerase [Candidatus Pelagibacter sp.]